MVSQPDQLYNLHPPDAQSSQASLGYHSRSLHNELPMTSNFYVVNESDKSSQNGSTERCKNGFGKAKNISRYLELADDVSTLGFQTCYQQEPRHPQQSPRQKQKQNKSALTSPKGVWSKNLGSTTKDIVERNKITLGHNASRSRCGSYARVHMLKQQRPHRANEVFTFFKEAVSTENPDDSSDPEFRVKHGQDSVMQLTSLLGHLHWSHIDLALSTGVKEMGSEKLSYTSAEGLNKQFIQQNVMMSSPGQRKLPFSDEGAQRNLGPHKDHAKPSFPRTRATSLSQTLGSYPVLPSIGKHATKSENLLGPGQCVSTACPIHKSSSDSCLSQLEKQRKQRDKVTYKPLSQAHSLRDDKQQAETKVQGLGCDDTVTEKATTIVTNKKRRSPVLLAKDPADDDKKFLRTKALDYAKTIAKPPSQFQPKQRQRQPTNTPCLQDAEMCQLAMLRKRHEEEKQTVAHFRQAHLI